MTCTYFTWFSTCWFFENFWCLGNSFAPVSFFPIPLLPHILMVWKKYVKKTCVVSSQSCNNHQWQWSTYIRKGKNDLIMSSQLVWHDKDYTLFKGLYRYAKFGSNWPSGSGEEKLLISSMCFHYFVIISPWRVPSFGTHLNAFYLRMLSANFGWNWFWRGRFFNFVNVGIFS